MVIELPDDDEPSNGGSEFDGRISLYEKYWLYVDGVRYTGPILRQSRATKQDTGESPLSRHYNHFYEKKEELKERCRELPGSLPEYKEQFGEPRGEVRKISLTDFDDIGIDWSDGDDPIWLPSEYGAPPIWEDDLDNMDKSEMRDLIRELRKERDDLEQRLQQVSRSLSNYLENQGDSQATETSQSTNTCEDCGQTFDSKAAKNGHMGHCDAVTTQDSPNDSMHSESEPLGLEELAKQLPEVKETQSTNNRESLSSEKEIENLNHLLSGNL